jgi:hypothetical protein
MRSIGRLSPKLRRILGWLTVGVLLALAFVVIPVAVWTPPEAVGESPLDGWHRYSGVVHVHTTLSDGGATPLQVVEAAQNSGLDFVGITDHNNQAAKPFEGYKGKTLVFAGSELSLTKGHFMALDFEQPSSFVFSRDPEDDIRDVHDLGGFGFAAHPTSPRSDLAFGAWNVAGDWGLEVLNGDSEWRSAGLGLFRTLAFYAVNRRYALLDALRPPAAALGAWDRLLAQRDAVGIFGADTHGRLAITRKRFIRFPSYEALFSVASIHVLLRNPLAGDFPRDRRAVLDAIRSGRLHIGIDSLASSADFSFVVASKRSDQTFAMGERVPWGEGLEARITGKMPKGTVVTLLRDGRVEARGTAGLVSRLAAPGVYRVEAHVPGWTMPWVITNPVYVFPSEIHEARARRGDWPAAPPAPSPTRILDSFDGPSSFVAEADTDSRIELPWQRPDEDEGGGGVARLAFALGHPGPGRPNVWCALVDRTPRNLGGATGLTLNIRADGIYRFWLQVRDRNEASRDDAEEWWFASIKTSTEWQHVAVPFARLRSLNSNTDGRVDVDKVKALVLVLDQAAVPPGTRGTIWIDDMGIY